MKKNIILLFTLLIFSNIFAQNFSSPTEPALVPVAANNHKLFVKFSSSFAYFDAEFQSGEDAETQFMMGINPFSSRHNPFSGLQLSAGYAIVPDVPNFFFLTKFAMFFRTNPNTGIILLAPGVRFSFINDGTWNAFIGGNFNFLVQYSEIDFGPEIGVGFDRKIIDCLSLGSDFSFGYLHKSFDGYSADLIFFNAGVSATLYFM